MVRCGEPNFNSNTFFFLIGTSFGTSATMGVICMILANASGTSHILSGGAIMSGIFFGDRCSPLSSSAMLVASVTDTDLYDNIKNMFHSAAVPFAVTCLLYLVLGLFGSIISHDQKIRNNLFCFLFYKSTNSGLFSSILLQKVPKLVSFSLFYQVIYIEYIN